MKHVKETVIGLSFLLAIALLFVGIRFLKGRNVFSNNAAYYVRYNDVTGLSDASPIYANGVRVGIVDDISYNYRHPGDIVVRILVDRRLEIPHGTVALLETELLGSVNVNLQLGSYGAPSYMPGDTLEGHLNKGLMAEVSSLMPAVRDIIYQVDTLLISAQALLADSSVTNILHNTEDLTSEARKKVIELSGLLSDVRVAVTTYQHMGERLDTLAGSLSDIARTAADDEWAARLTRILDHLEMVSSLLADEQGTAGKLLADPHLYDTLNETCDEARKLVEDIRENPGRYIHLFGKKQP